MATGIVISVRVIREIFMLSVPAIPTMGPSTEAMTTAMPSTVPPTTPPPTTAAPTTITTIEQQQTNEHAATHR